MVFVLFFFTDNRQTHQVTGMIMKSKSLEKRPTRSASSPIDYIWPLTSNSETSLVEKCISSTDEGIQARVSSSFSSIVPRKKKPIFQTKSSLKKLSGRNSTSLADSGTKSLRTLEEIKRLHAVPMKPKPKRNNTYLSLAIKRRNSGTEDGCKKRKASAEDIVQIRNIASGIVDNVMRTVTERKNFPEILANEYPASETDSIKRAGSYGVIPGIWLNDKPLDEFPGNEGLNVIDDLGHQHPLTVPTPKNSELDSSTRISIAGHKPPLPSTKKNSKIPVRNVNSSPDKRTYESPRSPKKRPSTQSPPHTGIIFSPKKQSPNKDQGSTAQKFVNVTMTKTFKMRAELGRNSRCSPPNAKAERITLT